MQKRFRQAQGSTLLLVLIIMGVVSILLAALNKTIASRADQLGMGIPSLKAALSASSKASLLKYANETGDKIDSSDSEVPARVREYLECPVKVHSKIIASEASSKTESYEVTARCPARLRAAKHKAYLVVLRQNYTSYLLSSSGDLLLAGIPGQSRYFLGPVFAGGNLIIKGGGHYFFTRPDWDSYALLAGQRLIFLDKWREYREQLRKDLSRDNDSISVEEKKIISKEKELLKKVSKLIEPIYTGYSDYRVSTDYPLKNVSARVLLLDEWSKVQNGQTSEFISAPHPPVFRLSPPSLGPIMARAKEIADENYVIHSLNTEVGTPIRIANGHLLEKRYIGSGTGRTLTFKIPFGHTPVTRVFLKDLREISQSGQQIPRNMKTHPVHDLEGLLGQDFIIRKNSIVFKKPTEKVRLVLPEDAFDYAGKIIIRGPSGSAFSAARELSKIYLEYLGNARELSEEDFRVDESRGELYIMNPDISTRIWIDVGTTDGVRRIFRAPVNLGEVVYLNGKASDGKVVPGSVVFPTVPEAGQAIQVMVLRPKLYGNKLPPGYQVGVFIDKDVKAVELDLSHLFPLPEGGIIVSHVPLYVHGTPPRRLSIFSTEDIYVGDINRDEYNPHFVLLASEGMIWGQRFRKSLQLRRVIFLSAGDGLFLNLSADPFAGNRKNAEKSIFTGSAYFSGKLKNLFYYPDMKPQKGYYYHPGRQADFNYFYEEALAEDQLLPLFVPESVHTIWQSY